LTSENEITQGFYSRLAFVEDNSKYSIKTQ